MYLDEERVRSVAAQLFSGLPAEAVSTMLHGGAGERDVPDELVPGDYRYFRSERETRSFHHHLYTLVEESLIQRGGVLNIDANYPSDKWTLDEFSDGKFVLVTGAIRLMDYSSVTSMLQALPKMMSAVTTVQNMQVTISNPVFNQATFKKQATALQAQRRQFEDMASLVSQMYGDLIRVKVMPRKDWPGKIFVGAASASGFHESSASLTRKYGYEIDAGWTVLGQINNAGGSDSPLEMPTGNSMEDALEGMALSFSNLYRIASGVQFPAVSFTPLAIYRLV